MRPLYEVGQLVKLFAAIVSATRHANAADIVGLVKDGERAFAFEHLFQFHELHAETQVGLVAAVAAHGLFPSHLAQGLGQIHTPNLLEQVAGHVLKELDDILLVHEAHLAVYLGELGLAVSTQVLVSETLGYLEITVEARHHEQLLQCLRALGKRVKLTWIHA